MTINRSRVPRARLSVLSRVLFYALNDKSFRCHVYFSSLSLPLFSSCSRVKNNTYDTKQMRGVQEKKNLWKKFRKEEKRNAFVIEIMYTKILFCYDVPGGERERMMICKISYHSRERTLPKRTLNLFFFFFFRCELKFRQPAQKRVRRREKVGEPHLDEEFNNRCKHAFTKNEVSPKE